MHWIKKLAAVAVATSLAVAGIGYGLAWQGRAACGDDMFADIQQRGVVGTGLYGTPEPLVRADVSTRVAGPFVVTVHYLVPRDLHGTGHWLRCSVGPFHRHLDLDTVETREHI
jgi:hypothetical protein